MTNTARRRNTGRWLAVVALGALALTGCGSDKPADRPESAAAAKPASSSASGDRTDARSQGGKESVAPAETPKKASPSAPAGNAGIRTDARSDSSEEAKDNSASTGRAAFAGTQQFVTIGKAWTEGGLTRLSVRPAQKKVNTQFDTWEIIPGTGAFTTVTMTKDARVLLTCPVRDEVAGTSRAEPLPYSPTRFVTLLNQLDSGLQDGIGYDLVFDGAGKVTSLKSLYRP